MTILNEDFETRTRSTDPASKTNDNLKAPNITPQPTQAQARVDDPPVASLGTGKAMERPDVLNPVDNAGWESVDDEPLRVFGTPEAFLDALKWKESKGKVGAVSQKDARGPYQIIPATGLDPGFGVKPIATEDLDNEPRAREFAKNYLDAMLREFNGDPKLALIAYNWGVGNARAYAKGEKTRLYTETEDYINVLVPAFYNSVNVSYTDADITAPNMAGVNPEEEIVDRSWRNADYMGALSILSGGAQIDTDGWETITSEAEVWSTINDSPPVYGWEEVKNDWSVGAGSALAGISNAYNALATYTEWLQDNSNPVMGAALNVTEEVFRDQATAMLVKAGKFSTQRSELENADTLLEMFTKQPFARAHRAFAGSAPLTGALLITTAINPKVGALATFAVMSGEAYATMEADKAAGVSIDKDYQAGAMLVSGVSGAVLETFGLNKILRAIGTKGLINKLAYTGIAAGTEGITETLQTATQDAVRLGYLDAVTVMEGFEQRYAEAFYGGLVVGAGLTGAGTTMSKFALPTPPDTELAGFDDSGDTASPMFLVNKPNHKMFGKVIPIQQAEELGLSVPQWRRESLKHSIMKSDVEASEADVEATLLLFDQMASASGHTLDEYIKETGLMLEKNATNVNSRDLFMWVGLRAGVDREAAKKYFDAQSMTLSGTDPEVIANITGWVKEEVSGKWLYDAGKLGFIDSLTASAELQKVFFSASNGLKEQEDARKHLGLTTTEFYLHEDMFDTSETYLGDLLGHDNKLFEYYPGLDQIIVLFNTHNDMQADAFVMDGYSQTKKLFGAFSPRSYTNSLIKLELTETRLKALMDGDAELLTELGKTLAHEVQHAIQSIEETASGGSMRLVSAFYAREYSAEVAALVDKREAGQLTSAETTQLATILTSPEYRQWEFDRYLNMVGEVRAREAADIDVTGQKGKASTGDKAWSHKNASVINIATAVYKTEDQLSEVEKEILRAWSDPNADFDIENVKGAIKGATSFKQGKTIIKLFEGSNTETLIHEMAHVYRRFTSKRKLKELEKRYGVTDGVWTREHEERFAREFTEWALSGKTDVPGLIQPFSQFRTWLVHYYASSISRVPNFLVSDENRAFFDMIVESELPPDLNLSKYDPTKINAFARTWNKFIDIFDIGAKFNRMGYDASGFAVTSYVGTVQGEVNKGIDVVDRLSRLLSGSRALMTEALLIAESKNKMAALEAGVNTITVDGETVELFPVSILKVKDKMHEAVTFLRSYFDSSLEEYIRLGGLQQGFVERMRQKLYERYEELQQLDEKSEGDYREMLRVLTEFDDLADLNYVHISLESIIHSAFDNIIEKQDTKAARRYLKVLAQRARESISIQTLIDDGLIDKSKLKLEDVIGSYANRKGKDIALLNIRQAAIRDGLASRNVGDNPENFVVSGKYSPVFKGYRLHPLIADWVQELTQPVDGMRPFRRWLSHTKMAAFLDPLFMPLFNVFQSVMRGTISPLRPIRTVRSFYLGITDYLNRTDEYYLAESFDISSPTSIEDRETQQFRYNAAARGRGSYTIGRVSAVWNRLMRSKKSENRIDNLFTGKFSIPLKLPFRMVAETYKISHELAWMGERMFRQVTYRYLKEYEGISSKEAARQTAIVTGGYGTVPAKTRRAMNLLLFTPTFKVAMAKFLIDSVRAVGSSLKGEATPSYRKRASVIMRSIGIMVATDMILRTGFGFDDDEYGRRYFKRIDTERGPKELVISWSSPHNMFTKYYNRFISITRPEVTNPAAHLLNQYRWEIHPFINVSTAVVTNRRPSGEPIYLASDHAEVKRLKLFKYWVGNIYAMFRHAAEEELDPRGEEQLKKEFGQMNEAVISMFAFPYEREIWEVRQKSKIDRLVSTMMSEISGNALTQQYLRGQITLEEFNTRASETGFRVDNMMERINAILAETEALSIQYDDSGIQEQDLDAWNLTNPESVDDGWETIE